MSLLHAAGPIAIAADRSGHASTWSVLVPVVVLAAAFLAFCVVDVVRTEEVQYLPRWSWGVICLITVPLGGIAYLLLGKSR